MQRRLTQARRLLAIARRRAWCITRTGAFDRERYQELCWALRRPSLPKLAGEISTEEIVQLFSREEGYANPKLDVRCAVFDDAGRVLLVREASDGLWSLPGGWADIGASPAENAMREVWEESGYTVTIERLLAVWDILKHNHPPSVFHIWKLVFLGKIVSSGDISGVETDAVEFFPIDALPPLSEGRVLPEQIRRLSELRANGGMEFD